MFYTPHARNKVRVILSSFSVAAIGLATETRADNIEKIQRIQLYA